MVSFLDPFHYPRTTLAPPPSSNSDPRPHSRGPPPPSPLRHVPSFFLSREQFSIFFPLVDSRRIAPTHLLGTLSSDMWYVDTRC